MIFGNKLLILRFLATQDYHASPSFLSCNAEYSHDIYHSRQQSAYNAKIPFPPLVELPHQPVKFYYFSAIQPQLSWPLLLGPAALNR